VTRSVGPLAFHRELEALGQDAIDDLRIDEVGAKRADAGAM
jgi:hypothetical protein